MNNTKVIVENFEEKLDDDIDLFVIERFRDKLSSKYDRMNTWSNKKEKINQRRRCTNVNTKAHKKLWFLLS